MRISKAQTRQLLESISSAKPDEMDCDGCFDQLAEFVEYELAGKEIPEALKMIHRHLEQCACCNDEHNALLEALKEAEG